MLVELRQVSFASDPERPVLSACDFALQARERVGLLGANGSGKTTLLHLIVGLLRPNAGEVIVFGRPRQREADFLEVRARVGLLFQDADDQLFCPTVAEDVAFGPLNLGKPREEVRQIVARTLAGLGLEDYEQRITYRLSGGEKRLVALATVLAMEPEVLLLDEPAGGLDDPSTDRLVRLLEEMDQAMVVVSHDQRLLGRLTNRRVRLQGGRLVPAD